jgi:NAD(P)-dependent dehydrogenase (short-subunit alcohol dehydrogenase family)
LQHVAIVTGATSGIGRATATLLARSGMAVMAAGRRSDLGESLEAELVSEGLTGRFIQCDVADEQSVARLVDEAVATHGRLDVVINNAAMFLQGSLEETTPEDWDRLLSVNLGGVYRVSRTAIPHIRASGGGSNDNIATVHAFATQPRVAAYAASKGAIVALTRQMAIDLVADGIRVNAIAVGGVDTPMAQASFRAARTTSEEAGWTHDARVLGRMGRPNEIAAVVEFLCSPGASFITGSTLVADAGLLARF